MTHLIETQPVRRALALGCLAVAALIAAPSAMAAGSDLLNVPALASAKASQALILGFARAGERLVAVGERGIVIYSDDQGANWTQAAVPVSVTLTAAMFPTPSQGWAVGHDGVVLHSADGGQSWIKVLDGNQSNALMQADARQRLADLQAQSNAPAAAIEAAENAVDDTQAAAKFGPSHPLLGVWFTDSENGIVVGSYGQILRTKDGGKTWASLGLALNNAEGLHYNAITATRSGAIIVVGEGGRVYRSTDGGDRWSQREIGGKGALLGVRALTAEPGGEMVLAYGFAGRAFRSDDQGENWQALASGTGKSVVDAALLEGHRLTLVDAGGALLQCAAKGEGFTVMGRLPQGMVEGMMPLNGGRLVLGGMGGIRVTDLNRLQK